MSWYTHHYGLPGDYTAALLVVDLSGTGSTRIEDWLARKSGTPDLNVDRVRSLDAANSAVSGTRYDLYLIVSPDDPATALRGCRRWFAAGGIRPVVLVTRKEHEHSVVSPDLPVAADLLFEEALSEDLLCRSVCYALVTHMRPAEAGEHATRPQMAVVLDSQSDGILVIARDGRVLYCNPASMNLLACDDLTGTEFGYPVVSGETTELEIAVRGDGIKTVEMRAIDTMWGETSASMALLRDITRERRAEEALRESEERYALALRGANDGIWDWDLDRERIYYSPRWKDILGYGHDELLNTREAYLRHVHPEDLPLLEEQLEAHLHGATPHFENEHRIRHKSGDYRWVRARGVAVRDANGKATRMAGSLSDIDERKRLEEQLAHQAFHDPLTGLPNRSYFAEEVDRAIKAAHRRDRSGFAVLFVDLDRFKAINDGYGHTVGDEVLTRVASRIQDSLRPGDLVARMGGDEFTILLYGADTMEEAAAIADRMQNAIGETVVVDEQHFRLSASIGILLNEGYGSSEAMLRDADAAMYQAKISGKARYAFFDPEARNREAEAKETEVALSDALREDRFLLLYQPIVSAPEQRVVGFEALLRWLHPTLGRIEPDRFIGIAEDTGLICPIGLWVLRQACRDLGRCQRERPATPPLYVSVNLSPRQLLQPGFLGDLKSIYLSESLPEGSLHLEVTENVFLESSDAVEEMIREIRDLGIRVFIDDFGTGYSSLRYLQELAIDGIKIDRSFVSHMKGSERNDQIVRTIIDLASSLDLDVTAEGVETEEQRRRLNDLACPHEQGFLFSRPVPIDAIGGLLREH